MLETSNNPSSCTTMTILHFFKRVRLASLEERTKENTWDAFFLDMGRTNQLLSDALSYC